MSSVNEYVAWLDDTVSISACGLITKTRNNFQQKRWQLTFFCLRWQSPSTTVLVLWYWAQACPRLLTTHRGFPWVTGNWRLRCAVFMQKGMVPVGSSGRLTLLNLLCAWRTSEKPLGEGKREEVRRLRCLPSRSLQRVGRRGRRKLWTCTSCSWVYVSGKKAWVTTYSDIHSYCISLYTIHTSVGDLLSSKLYFFTWGCALSRQNNWARYRCR